MAEILNQSMPVAVLQKVTGSTVYYFAVRVASHIAIYTQISYTDSQVRNAAGKCATVLKIVSFCSGCMLMALHDCQLKVVPSL